MAIYLVGDIQGCFQELSALLKKVNFQPTTDELWLTGDLVARGPDSLATLRFVKSLGSNAKTVLGNHDLHLLAIYHNLKKPKASDKLKAVLSAPDCDELMHWLIQQPLLRQLPNENAFMSHAGISPQWTVEEAVTQAKLAEQKLQSADAVKWLATMYGNEPNNWQQAASESSQFRFTINALTRMRYCFKDGSLDFKEKLAPSKTNLTPWFTLCKTLETTQWIFGHWAALMGQANNKNCYALDTGCVWGNQLTMLRWHDKQFFSVNKQ